MSELRRQLAAAEEAREAAGKMQSRHEALESIVAEWAALFASSDAANDLTLTSDGLPDPAAPAKLRARLSSLGDTNASMLKEMGQVQAKLREAEAAAAAATRGKSEAGAEGAAARQAVVTAEEEAARAGWAATELKVKLTSVEEYCAMLEVDREKLRNPSKKGAGAAAASTEEARPGEAAALRAQLTASQERCALLTSQAEAAAARAAEAAEATKTAKGEAAAATQSAASATALHRQASLSAQPPAPAPAPSAASEGGGGEGGMKVLHMVHNPSSNAQQAMIEGLKARVRALRMQLDVSEAGVAAAADSAAGGKDALAVAAAAASSIEAQSECEELRKQVRDLTTQKERLKTVFQSKIKEFRDKVQVLTGYRVDLPNAPPMNLYNLYPPYRPPTSEYVLTFRDNKEGKRGFCTPLVTQPFADLLRPSLDWQLVWSS